MSLPRTSIMLLTSFVIAIPGISLIYASPFPADNGTSNENNETRFVVNGTDILDENDVNFFAPQSMVNETGLVNGTGVLDDNDVSFNATSSMVNQTDLVNGTGVLDENDVNFSPISMVDETDSVNGTGVLDDYYVNFFEDKDVLVDNDVSFNATSSMVNETGLVNGTDILNDNDVNFNQNSSTVNETGLVNDTDILYDNDFSSVI